MAGIKEGFDSLDAILRLADNARNIGPADLRLAMQVGIPQAQRTAQKMLASQLRRSGIQRRTGQLENMAKRAKLSISDPASSSVSLNIAMPPGMDKGDYIKANSLNYGSVRGDGLSQRGANGRKLVGDKTLQKLKAQAGSLKAGTFRQVSKTLGVLQQSDRQTKAGSTVLDTTAGTVKVTKAFKFFFLTNSQLATIKDIIFRSAFDYLTAKIEGRRLTRKAA